MIATGSPRKRYDRAAKTGAAVLLSYVVRDGQTVQGARGDLTLMETVTELTRPLLAAANE
jgi:hypothetical protein